MKIYTWFLGHSKKTRVLFAIAVGIHLLNALLRALFVARTLPAIAGRVTGSFLVTFVPVLLAAMLVAYPIYGIFRNVAETYKRYLDYLAVALLALSLLMFYASHKAATLHQAYL